mgnify:CR=1 FL=1
MLPLGLHFIRNIDNNINIEYKIYIVVNIAGLGQHQNVINFVEL